MVEDRKDAESLLNKHRTKYCFIAHRAACKPDDPNSEYQVGDRVCKLTDVNRENRQIWCVVAIGKGSRCFTFAPNSREDNEPDTCTVIAPFSDTEKGHVESREHWLVKYDRSLLTKAPSYHCGGTVRISVNARLEHHVIQECDWTYNDLYTGWIYRIEDADHGWMTERFLDEAIKRALLPVNPVKTEAHDTITEPPEPAERPSKSKRSKKKHKEPNEDDSKQAEMK
ncbi:hypothetical protein LTR84_003394 [Exophiala bonariae]|uniref:SH3 domain-containing protein n=1 Tax=Exophiala bonariae TaxID=1690606 RepID=A0AAV9N6S3_9EURO|nr:hypothetical protein LTR84_003394 [Exophiala bonariae]